MSDGSAGSDAATAVSAGPGLRAGLGPTVLGLVVLTGLLFAHGLYQIAFEGAIRLGSQLRGGPYSTSLVIELLIAGLLASRVMLRRANLRDLAGLRPRLRCAPDELRALVRDFAGVLRAPALYAILVAVPIGLLVVPDSRIRGPYLLSGDPWSAVFVWSLLLNALLFALMGLLVQETFAQMKRLAWLENQLGDIDLLDLEPLRLFTRWGLRVAAVWLLGSAVASLIFVNVAYHWATGAVILGTLGVGTLAFLLPMRGLHGRLRSARRAELARVRGAIAAQRADLLEGGGAASLVALLAYEARIERVREWPFDTPTLLRFLLLALLAAGSWLGGALVERLLGSLLD